MHNIFPQLNTNSEFGTVKMEIGIEFNTLAKFKSVVKEYTIFFGREIKWKKDDSIKARAICKKPTCD